MKSEVARKSNVIWFNGLVSREDREKLHGHKGAVIWLTGLSASGKSTIAHHLEKILYEKDCSTYVFDGTMCGTASVVTSVFRQRTARRTSAASVRW